MDKIPVLRLAAVINSSAVQPEPPIAPRPQQPQPARAVQGGQAASQRQAGGLRENRWEAPVAGGPLPALAEHQLQAGQRGRQEAPNKAKPVRLFQAEKCLGVLKVF